MTPDDLSSLDVCRLEFRLRALERARLPAFPGPALRGAFGRAVERKSCLESIDRCVSSGCTAPSRCFYTYLIDTTEAWSVTPRKGQAKPPVPYVLSASSLHERPSSPLVELEPGDELAFRLTLLGRGTSHAPLVRDAVADMATRGIGEDGTAFRFDVVEDPMPASTTESDRASVVPLSELVRKRIASLVSKNRIGLRLETPMRIRLQGRNVTRPTAATVVERIAARLLDVSSAHGGSPIDVVAEARAAASQLRTPSVRLHWNDTPSHNSSSQHTRMKLGGVEGELWIEGDAVRDIVALLAAGEVLHVGSGTSSGLGRIRLIS